jgi:VCBS repeat-containing protein
MQHLRARSIATFAFLLCSALVPVLRGETLTFQVLIDSDRSADTGCSVATSAGIFRGAEQVISTTVERNATGSIGGPVTRQQCVSGSLSGATDLGVPQWPIAAQAGGAMIFETAIPRFAFGSTVPNQMRVGFVVQSGASIGAVFTNGDGSAILLPAKLGRRRVAGVPGDERVIHLDGIGTDWNGLDPIASHVTNSGASATTLNAMYAFLDEANLYFRIDSGSSPAPTANDDIYNVRQGHLLNVGAPGVLQNDSDPAGVPLAATATSSPTHGALSLHADGGFTYLNDGSFAPVDFFNYFATNGAADSNGAQVTINVTPDAAPVAVADAYNVAHGGTVTIVAPGVLSNDTDADNDPLSAIVNTLPIHGTVNLLSNGALTYTHDGSNTLADSLTYHASDGVLSSAPATVTLTIGPDAAPVAVNDVYTVAEGGTLTRTAATAFVANDTDADTPHGSLVATVLTQPVHGALTANGDGSFTYVHDGSETSVDSFTYSISDGIATSGIATVQLNITQVNDAPVANDDAYLMTEDTPLTIGAAAGLQNNDHDAEGSPMVASVVAPPSRGTLTLNADGSFTYTPAADDNGVVTFTYRVSDGALFSNTATVTLTIAAVNDAPVAVNDAYTTAEDTPLAIAAPGVLSNDTDVDHDPLTSTIVANAAHGNVVVNANGSFTYTPNANYNGPDSFTYQAHDAALASNTATVTLTVTAVNDAPVAVNDAYSTAEDTPLVIAAAAGVIVNDSDVDADPLTATILANAAHGNVVLNADGSFTYTPAANYNGPDSFTYQAHDASLASNTATVTLTVTPVNDAPVAANDTYTTAEDTPLTVPVAGVLANDTDVDLDPLTATIVANAAHGNVVLNANGSFTYTPNANDNGPDSFTYQAHDAALASNIATVSITVTAANDAPVAVDDAYLVTEGQSLTTSLANGVLVNDSDVDADPLTAVLVTGPAHGTLTLNPDGTITYVHDGTDTGADSFTYRANDGTTNSNTATVTINVTPVNDAPVAVNDVYTVLEGGSLNIAAPGVIANDTDEESNPLTATVVTGPAHGSLSLASDGSFLYNHDGTDSGNDSFTYTVNDGTSTSNTATVTINVTPVNDAPIANADAYTVLEAATLTVPVGTGVIANDVDEESNPLTASVIATPAHGSLTLNANGSFTYTHDGTDTGNDSFTYTVSDGTSTSNTATVTINVTPVNDAPVAAAGSYGVNEGATLNISAPGVLTGATDEESDPLTAVVGTGPTHGSLTLNSDGSFTYTHDGTDSGNDSFTFSANDGSSSSPPQTITILVTPLNDAPVANNDAYSVNEAQTLTLPALTGVIANDTDEESNPLTASVVATPAHGSLTLNANGSFTYTHDGTDTGNDSFTYTVSDGTSTSNIATVSINVTPVNDAPVAVADSYPVLEAGTINIAAATGVLTNDTDEEANPLTAVLVAGPAHGSLTLNANGSFSYTHDGTDTGSDSFTYKANDGTSDSNVATVTIVVTPVNDAPVANPDSYGVVEAGTINIAAATGVLVNDTDEESNPLTAIVVAAPAHGALTLNANGSFTYTHDGTDSGNDSFTYKANDGTSDSNVTTVTINVTPVNDAPIANTDAYPVLEAGTLNIAAASGVLSNDTDEEGNPLTAILATGPAHGSLTLNANGSFTYTHDGTDTGNDSFTYKANDGTTDSNVTTVTINVTPVNDPPVVANQSYGVNEGATLTIAAPGVLTGATDEEGNAITAVVATGPAHASAFTLNANGSFSYTHDGTDSGNDSFTFTGNDGTSSSAPKTVTILVTPLNDAPVANVDAYGVAEGGTLNVAAAGVLANDVDEESNPLTAILVIGPTHASAFTLNANGSFTYTHDGSETGTDSFTYKANDGTSDSNVTTVTITVTAVNDAPVANTDAATVAEDPAGPAFLTIPAATLLANDAAGGGETGQVLSIVSVQNPTHGTVSFAGGNVIFHPTLNFTGAATFQYTITDDGTTNGSPDPKTATGTVNVTVTEVNDTPITANDNATIAEDGVLTMPATDLLLNDDAGPLLDGDGLPTADETAQTLTVTSLGVPSAGTATLVGGTITFTPPANGTGVFAIPYRVQDNGTTNGAAAPILKSTGQFLMVDVTPVNDPPVANPDTVNATEDTALPITAASLLANDTRGPNEGSQTITITSVGNPQHGTVTLIGTNITFMPDPDYFGPASFDYTVTDDGTTNGSPDPKTATTTVTVNVSEVNDAPVPVADAKTTVEDTPLVFPATDLTANDSKGAANESTQTLTVTAVSAPTGGTVSLVAGTITFTPTADYFGPASFQYTVTDNGTTNGAADPKTATATVNVTVTEVNDAPVAVADAKSVAEDNVLTFPATDLLANDSKGNAFESAQTLTVTAVSNPTNGTVSLVAGTITFTPNANFFGAATFDYTITDNGTTNGAPDPKTATGTVTVTVTDVNDAPTAVADALSTAEDNALVIPAATLLANDAKGPANESAQTLTITSVGSATNGTVGLAGATVTFTPTANYFGPASFQYTITDDGTTNGAADPKTSTTTVSITITEVNDAPVANADTKSTVEDTPLTFPANDLLANDSVGNAFESAQTITVTAVSNLTGGTVSLNSGNITFTPAANFFGAATFQYTITDNGTTNGAADPKTANGTVTVNVSAVNDAPIAVNDLYSVPPSGTLTVAAPGVLGNDTDVDTAPASLTAIKLSDPSEGTLTFNADGSFTYVKPVSPVGLGVTFTYKVNDGSADSNVATVTITYNSPPVAVDDGVYFFNEDSTLTRTAANGLRINDSDPDNNITKVLLVSAPAVGTLNTTVNGADTEIGANDGSFTYTPPANVFGTVTFTYKLRDAGGLESSPATVTITVNPINDEPTFTAPTTTIALNEDAPTFNQAWATNITPGGVGNTYESSQQVHFVTSVSNAALFDNSIQCGPPGITCDASVSPVSVDPVTGNLVFKLAANANGTSTVTVNLVDDGGVFSPGDDDTSQPVTFTVSVSAVNDAPTFVKGADQQVNTADGVARTVNGWAAPASFSVGPADEVSAGQTITSFAVTNVSDASFFSAQPAVSLATGTLTFTPVNNAAKTGQVTVTVTITDNGGTALGGVNASSQTFIINFGTAATANQRPNFTAGPDKSYAAGTTGVQSFVWATSINKGSPSESGQTLNFIVPPSNNPSIFAAGGEPVINATTGVMTFTLSGVTGGSTFSITLHDDGGTAFGGQDTSPAKIFHIYVGPVNQPPTYTPGPNITVNEDSGPYSAPWATAITPNTGGTNVTFSLSVSDPTLFSVQPAISPAGVLTFTPAPDAGGFVLVDVTPHDDGGTANGGVDTGVTRGFNINVNFVNDQPSFTIPATLNVSANSGTHTYPSFVTSINWGAANELQGPSAFTITQTSTTNAALFSAPPAFNNIFNRDLSFTLAPNQGGSATFSMVLKDNGGNANGGVDTSAPQFFTINAPANGFPVGPAAPSITAYANISLSITNNASDQPYRLLQGWSDPNNELPLSVTIVQKPAGSIVTIDDATTGAFTFRNGPLSFTAGSINPQTFQYQVCDAGGTCGVIQTMTVNFFAPLVFFSDDTAPASASGFGTLDIPVKGFMPGFTNAAAPPATYIIASGNYSIGVHGTTYGTHIRSGDKVLGQGLAGLTLASLGITAPAVGTLPALPDFSTGTTPAIFVTTPWEAGTGSYIGDSNIGALFIGYDGGTVKNLNVTEEEERTGSWLLLAPGGAGFCCIGSPAGTTGTYLFDRVTLNNGQGFIIGPEGSTLTISNSSIRSSAPFGLNNATVNIVNTSINVDITGEPLVSEVYFLQRTGSGIPVYNVTLTADAASAITLGDRGFMFDPNASASTPAGTYTFNGPLTMNRTTVGRNGLAIAAKSGVTFAFNGKVDVTVNRAQPLIVTSTAAGDGTLTMPNAANTFKITNATSANIGTAMSFSNVGVGAGGVMLSNLNLKGGNMVFTNTGSGPGGPISVKSGTVTGNGAQQCVVLTSAPNVTIDAAVVFTNCTP